MDKRPLERLDGEVISHGVIPMLAENMKYQYGSEAFEEFKKQQDKKESGSQIVVLVPKKEEIRRQTERGT